MAKNTPRVLAQIYIETIHYRAQAAEKTADTYPKMAIM